MNWAWFGLGLIIIGWAIQLFHTLKGRKEINPCFVGVQAVGILMLVYSSWASDNTLALLNLGSFTVSVLVLLFTIKKFGCSCGCCGPDKAEAKPAAAKTAKKRTK